MSPSRDENLRRVLLDYYEASVKEAEGGESVYEQDFVERIKALTEIQGVDGGDAA